MLRLALICVAGCLASATAATAQPLASSSTSLTRAAFAPRALNSVEPVNERRVEQAIASSAKGKLSLFAGASGPDADLDGPRWRAGAGARSPNTLVNTRVGVEWNQGETRTSLGYLRRELPGPAAAFSEKRRRDSMLGVAVSFRPKF